MGEARVGHQEGRERACLLVADVVGGKIEVGEARDLGEERGVMISSGEYDGRIHVNIVPDVCVVAEVEEREVLALPLLEYQRESGQVDLTVVEVEVGEAWQDTSLAKGKYVAINVAAAEVETR